MKIFKHGTAKTKFMALLISASLILPAVVSAANTDAKEIITIEPAIQAEYSEAFSDYLKNPERWGSVIPNPIELQIPERISLANDFPAAYNSLTANPDNTGLFPAIRNQGSDGDCWSYSAAAALEFSSVLHNGKDFSSSGALFSEHHMVGSMNKTNDADYQKYTFDSEDGGNYNMAVAYLTRDIGGGPVKLSDFSEELYHKYAEQKNDYSMLADIQRTGYMDKAYFLTDLYDGSSVMTFDIENDTVTNINYTLNQSSIDAIKSGIMEYGAVSASYYAYTGNNKYYNPKTSAYCVSWDDMISGNTIEETLIDGSKFYNKVEFYTNGTYKFSSPTNHAITIVGWDDDYSYENFKTTPVSGDGTPINGAWIVRNSWGEDYADNGYEYVSYMDPTIGMNAVVYSVSDKNIENIYSYDTHGLSGSLGFSSASISIANRYTATEDNESVTAIGTYVINAGESFEIYIDDNAEASSDSPAELSQSKFTNNRVTLLDPETKNETKKVTVNDIGYFALELADPITVSGNFDVIIKIYSPDGSNTVSVPICSATQNYSSAFESTADVSYYSSGLLGNSIVSWKDIGDSNHNLCVKAYTNSVDTAPSESPSAVPTVTPTLTPTQTPSAAPSESPSAEPTGMPTSTPSETPSSAPSESPSAEPTGMPTPTPSETPSAAPSASPSAAPSASPSAAPEDTFVISTPKVDRENKTMSFSIEQIGEANDSTLWIASYTADGMFVGCVKGTLESSKYDGANIIYPLTDCQYVDSAYCKIFIWDKDLYKPYLINPIYVQLN